MFLRTAAIAHCPPAARAAGFLCGILGPMDVNQVELASIDFSNETYRISEDLDPSPVEDSLRQIGQLNPVVLCRNGAAPRFIVAGFRRLRALKRLGKERCLAAVAGAEHQPLSLFRIALWDNLSHRRLVTLEKARVIHALRHSFGVESDSLVKDYLPLLGLESHKNVLLSCERLHLLDASLRIHLNEDRLTPGSAEHLAARSLDEQRAMASLFDKCRFSASLQRQVLDLTDELAAIEERPANEILGLPEILEITRNPGLSAFQRGEAVFRFLRRRRNPRLSGAVERFQAEREGLRLPGAVRIAPDAFFERPLVRVEFETRSAAEFREIAGALQRASQQSGLEELFRVK